jgi:TonB dependent receptor-like, beta-barrel
MPYWGFYVEDKWQLKPRWTLSAGLRYDLGIQTYSGNRYGNAIVDMNYDGWQLAIPGRAPGLDLHYLPADKNNFAPRVSLAYEPTPGWVLRAGYGVFYDLGITTTGVARIGDGFGGVPGYVGDFYANFRFDVPDDVPVMTLDNVFPAPSTVPVGTYPISTGPGTGYFDYQASVRYMDEQSRDTPYFHRFVVSTEKQIGPRTAVSVFYTGSRGRDLQYYDNQNIPGYQSGWSSEDEFNDARPRALLCTLVMVSASPDSATYTPDRRQPYSAPRMSPVNESPYGISQVAAATNRCGCEKIASPRPS